MREAKCLEPLDLIRTAKDLLQSTDGKLRQSNLHRATSAAYYALFHTLARCAADCLIGGPGSQRSKPAWYQVYRALEHGQVKAACKSANVISRFPQRIQDFANLFITMQEKRHIADYNPYARSKKPEVSTDIELVEAVIKGFESAAIKDRRAFAAFVLLKPPRKP